jgi:D-alanyl-D-alanine dipeptidase
MKSDKNIVQPESSNIREMTDEEKAETAYITRNSYHKEKFRKSLKLYTRMKIQAFAGTHPELNAKDLLVEIIKCYNPKLPPVVLLEMTQYILEEWEKIQAKKKTMQLA